MLCLAQPLHASTCISAFKWATTGFSPNAYLPTTDINLSSLRLILGLFKDSFNCRGYRPIASNYVGRVCISSCYVKT